MDATGCFAEIYDSIGFLPWYLKAKIQKVLFGRGPKLPGRVVRGFAFEVMIGAYILENMNMESTDALKRTVCE